MIFVHLLCSTSGYILITLCFIFTYWGFSAALALRVKCVHSGAFKVALHAHETTGYCSPPAVQ